MSAKKIIMVDDDEDILGFLKIIFEERGFEVRTAPGGEELFKILASFTPDAILLDMMMPRMSGETVLQKIRADRAFDAIKVFFLSVLILPEEKINLFEKEYKISGYFNKPFAGKDLVANIINALDPSQN